ncbi:ABC transporter ATP-binding protein [Mesorhizobium sp. M0222]|uniref:ABC transporter ATP-binding protein n=1 Tax=Mesorhizobium sp. M0222 TaxID=2956921 RepID=UPI00333DC4DA
MVNIPRKRGADIELQNLSKFYGNLSAVENVNLSFNAGEFVTFLGPSGSGKSTTLMMIAGFTVPSSGEIKVNGSSIIQQPVHKRNIGMVFQNYALFPHLSVAQNVSFPLEMRGRGRSEIAERVKRGLASVRLDQLGDRRPAQLSGGQQQRVALARALVFEPPVLLLDEPLGALDAKLREEMKFELKQLHQNVGATIIFVTHDQEEALTLSDRVAVFNRGKVVQYGTPEALYNSPESRFVAEFIGESNLLQGTVLETNADGCRLRLADGIELTAPLRSGWSEPKKSATYMLRLEPVVLGAAAASKEVCIEARLEEFLFVGNAIKYLLRIGADIFIKARAHATGKSQDFRTGDTLKVGWNREDMLLVDSQ